MQVNPVYNFFFHPLSEQHSLPVKVISVITAVALSILTAGLYLAVFACVNLSDGHSFKKADPKKPLINDNPVLPVNNNPVLPVHNSPILPVVETNGFVGTEGLKNKQKNHLQKLQALASRGEWEHLREHTAHVDSGFDWWMFPTDRSTLGQGDKYKVGKEDIKKLKADAEFMESYRSGVKLVLLSWGWDAPSNNLVQNNKQRWTNYQVRLGKMIHSLTLFEEKELLQSVKMFCDTRGITPDLQPWIRKYLKS